MATTEQRATGAEDVAWDLSDLFAAAGDPKLEAELADVARSADAFRERYHGRVAALSAAELAEAVAERERIDSAVTRARTFAHLNFSTNTADPARGALLARIQERVAANETKLLFARLEWAALDDERVEKLLADPALARWVHYLRAIRRYRPHLLSEPEETILTEKAVTGMTAWSRLYSELLSGIRVTVDGEESGLERALAQLQSADRDTRAAAAAGITEALAPGLRTRTFVFNAMLLDKATDDRLRGYPHWLAARNLANEVPDETVEALVSAVVSRYDIPQRYYRLKADVLGLPKLADYDRAAPISATESFTTWEEARELILGAYADFAPEAGRIVSDFWARGWIDAPVRPDKQIGAFCATTVPGVHPYVLMNYTGDRRSMLTLAHELGHGLHGVLAQPLGLFNAATPLTLAETASVFGEALTFKALTAREDDPRRRLDLLTGRLEDAIATVFRQIAFNRLEDALHGARRGEGELSPDRIGELFLETQEAMLGEPVELSEGFERWWSYVPHFVAAPGYVYAYAYGYLFSLAIFRRYEREGDAMVEPYFDLLRAGGSRPPEELAALVGLDLADPALWADGLAAVDEILAEAEALAGELGLGRRSA